MIQRIYPVITLYQPWATWVMRGWKTIETRTHDRFKSLRGKKILIHAGQTTDSSPLVTHNPYLTREQILFDPDEVINGAIIGECGVCNFGKLASTHSQRALIDCENTVRWGVFLTDIKKFEQPIAVKGERGIWYFDMETMQKVKHNACKSNPTLFK